jgi:hypothetical protein
MSLCVLAPAREPGFRRAFVVTGGRIAAVRNVPSGAGARLEILAVLAQAGLSEQVTKCHEAPPSYAPEDADELLVLAGFLRRPGPELRVVSLDADEILAA